MRQRVELAIVMLPDYEVGRVIGNELIVCVAADVTDVLDIFNCAPEVDTAPSSRNWLSVESREPVSATAPTKRNHPAVPVAPAMHDHTCEARFGRMPAAAASNFRPLTADTPDAIA